MEYGIGLNSVKDVVEKYNGEVKTEYDDREFCIRIILYTDNYCWKDIYKILCMYVILLMLLSVSCTLSAVKDD